MPMSTAHHGPRGLRTWDRHFPNMDRGQCREVAEEEAARLGVEGRREDGDQKAYKYLSNFKMQIPGLCPCWDPIFCYHLSGESLGE